jgi:signal peptidase I
MKVSLREILLTLFIILLIFVTLRVTVHSYKVYGQSMDPSFHNGQYLLVNKASYHLHSPRRGDVIVFQFPLNPSELYIKRIIGLPGEKVEIRNNQVYIDDELLEEPE